MNIIQNIQNRIYELKGERIVLNRDWNRDSVYYFALCASINIFWDAFQLYKVDFRLALIK